MLRNKILVLPSWYATKNAPTSGSFFQEQSALLEDEKLGTIKWQVEVLTTEKVWISKQRHLFYKIFPTKIPFSYSDQIISPPNGKVIEYPFCKFISEEENLKSEVNAILRYFENFPDQKPDIIHAHCALRGGVLARYVADKLEIPYVITEHMNPFLLHTYSNFWKNEIIQSIENASTILAVSEHQKQQLLMHEIKCNPIVTGNLVDDSRFVINEKIENQQDIHFLIVTFYPNFIKDMDTFFEALVYLQKSNALEGKHFTIIGGGELSGEYNENYYQNKIAKHQLETWVDVVPKANRDEMVQFMQKTDALISTSIAETFGVAICEAMLCGKPVITTLNGGVNDYITHENSISVPIKNPRALAEAIEHFMKIRGTFDAKNIRTTIVNKFGRIAFRDRMDDLYKSVLK